jgi:hypothetical protein
MTRTSCHAPTKVYVARRTAEGKSKREIMRILKRYVAPPELEAKSNFVGHSERC